MAKRKKTKRRAPKKKTQLAEEPDEVEAAEASAADEGDDDAVEARFDEDEETGAAAVEPPANPKLSGRPVGPALDPGSPNAEVSTGGGLWVMAVVFGLILAAVLVQYFLG